MDSPETKEVKPIRAWRVVGESEFGAYCFFDSSREIIEIRDLTNEEIRDRVVFDVSVSALDGDGDEFTQLAFFSIKTEEVPF